MGAGRMWVALVNGDLLNLDLARVVRAIPQVPLVTPGAWVVVAVVDGPPVAVKEFPSEAAAQAFVIALRDSISAVSV